MCLRTNLSLGLTSLALAVSLAACGGNGSAGPATTTTSGQLLSQSDLGVTSSIPQIAETFVTTQFNPGLDPESGGESAAYMNVYNAAESYKFPYAPPLSLSTDPNQYLTDYIVNGATIGGQTITGVGAYAITYNTPGVAPLTNPSDVSRTVSGLVLIPKVGSNFMTTPRGMVLFYHGTTLAKNAVPSCLAIPGVASPSYCSVSVPDSSGAALFYQLAALYVSRGFVVVAPDYIGQGIDQEVIHPYVAYPEVNATSGLNMLAATRQLFSSLNISNSPLKLLITGYSEGGGYALNASQLAQTSAATMLSNNNIQLLVTAPAEGAYALATQMQFAFDNLKDGIFNGSYANESMMLEDETNVNPGVAAENSWNIVSAPTAGGYKPALLSYVLTAIMNYSFHNLGGAYASAMYGPFWQNILLGNNLYNLYQLFATPSLSTAAIALALDANTISNFNYDPAVDLSLTLFIGSFPLPGFNPINLGVNNYGQLNSALAFIYSAATRTQEFNKIIQNGSTYQWKTQSPINFINLTHDSVVAVANEQTAYAYMNAQAPNLVQHTLIQNFQMTNDLFQYLPMGTQTPFPLPARAVSKFWEVLNANFMSKIPSYLAKNVAQPNDHGSSISQSLALIIALCTFENGLNNDFTNPGVCPNLN